MNKYRGNKHNMILKIDLEKAFDRLEWSFVYRALRFFKFYPNITKLIMNCISSSRIAILVNGTRTSYFSPSRGIRQGDPISPYLFILCMEMLSTLINHKVDLGCWDPITIGIKKYQISHYFLQMI